MLRRAIWDVLSFAGRHYGRLAPDVLSARVRFLADAVQRPRLEVRRLTGPDAAGVHVGNDAALATDLAQVLGAQVGPPGEKVLRETLTPARAMALAGGADLVAVEVERWRADSFRDAGFRVLPRWVHFAIDLGTPEASLWDEKRLWRVRKIERSTLRAEVATGDAGLDAFYDAMYVPTALRRHGERAHVRSRAFVGRVARQGEILFVVDGDTGERVAGIVLVGRLGARWIDAWLVGVAGGDYERVGGLAREALYLFAVRHARDARGARTFGLTAASPFPESGLFRFKKSWGAEPYVDESDGRGLAVRIANEALAKRLDGALY